MAQNNPFHFDIDDDGLPKYSPDRKNITAYHMYKLGMTDSLPDPDVPEPLFRTPSYVKEMEEREREREREMNRLAQLSRPVPSPFSGEDGVTNPVDGLKPVELKPLALDTGKETSPFSSVTPDAAVVGDKDDTGQAHQLSSASAILKETLDKLTNGYLKMYGDKGWMNHAVPDTPVPDGQPSLQTFESAAERIDSQSTDIRKTEPPSETIPSVPVVTPMRPQAEPLSPAVVPAQPATGTEMASGSTGGDQSDSPGLVDNTLNTVNQVFSQFNNAITADDIRAIYGYKTPGLPSGQTGQGGDMADSPDRSMTTSEQDEGCGPLAVNPVDSSRIRLRQGRRAISPELTDSINTELTRKNQCRPIGINSSQLSIYEGGSHEKAYVPYSAKTARGNRSGVTVGSGFDLGQRKKPEELRAMGLPESLVQKFTPYLGLQKMEAVVFLKNHPLTLSQDEIDTVNRCVIIDMGRKAIRHWDTQIDRLRKTYPNAPYFHEMNTNQQTIVFSRYYQEGQKWIGNHPDIHKSILKNDWDETKKHWDNLIQNNENSGREWQADRLKKESQYLWSKKK